MHQSLGAWLHAGILARGLVLYALGFVVLLLALGMFPQPYLAHDDLDWLLPKSYGGVFESPWRKSLSEGRWLNLVWYELSQRLTVLEVFYLFLPAFIVYFYLCGMLFRTNVLLAAVLLTASPTASVLLIYPATLFFGIVIFGGLTCLISRCESWGGILPLAFVAFFLCYMTYPTFGPLLVLLLAATRVDHSRRWVELIALYIVAFALSIVTIFTFNYLFHGVFGIVPAGWRGASPISSLTEVPTNISRYLVSVTQAVSRNWYVVALSAMGYIVCIIKNTHRRYCVSALSAGAVLLLIDAVLAISNGLPFYERTHLWLWALYCIPAIYLCGATFGQRVFGVVLATAIAVSGVSIWRDFSRPRAPVYPMMDVIGREVALWKGIYGEQINKVILVGDPSVNPQLAFLGEQKIQRMLRNYVYKRYGILSEPCAASMCESAMAEFEKSQQRFLKLDQTLLVILSQKP